MSPNEKQPSMNHIERSCRNIKRGWSADERKHREVVAVARQRQLAQFLCNAWRSDEA